MKSLPREVLKWLQTLDLSVNFKSPKHDCANGYLIAEIFSHYYPADINIHLYSNGLSLDTKLNNWSQLERFFCKNGIEISREAMDAVINCRSGAAVHFLQNTFHLLTNRSLNTFPTPENERALPLYGSVDPSLPRHARTTASALIRSIPDTEFAINKDAVVSRRKVQAVVEWQADAEKQLRLKERKKRSEKNHDHEKPQPDVIIMEQLAKELML